MIEDMKIIFRKLWKIQTNERIKEIEYIETIISFENQNEQKIIMNGLKSFNIHLINDILVISKQNYLLDDKTD